MELGIENFNHLNIYIKQLSDKKAITKVVGGYEIHPILIPDGETEIVFELVP